MSLFFSSSSFLWISLVHYFAFYFYFFYGTIYLNRLTEFTATV